MSRRILISLADATAFVHSAVYIAAILWLAVALILTIFLAIIDCCLGQEINEQLLKVPVSAILHIVDLLIITAIGQTLFASDCPVRIFEYCLRSFAKQEFSYDGRCYVMKEMVTATDYPERPRLYRRLLRQSGIFFAAATVVLIIPQIVLVFI